MLNEVIENTERFIASVPKAKRKKYGQFFTNSTTAKFMASLFCFDLSKQKIEILDAGTGILAAAVVQKLYELGYVGKIYVTCYVRGISFKKETMKRIFLFYIMAIMAISMSAQNDVTTFWGIPVDGFKSEMKQKLVSKGFMPKKVGANEFLEGEFNGTDVHVYIATNNNKVYRIMLCDANTQNEANIKIRFNKLVSQFENNKRYTSLDKNTLCLMRKTFRMK